MRRQRGAVALLFIPIIGIILIFVMMLMNASQVALQKAMTANAADAACIGGASYIASGMQEAAWISRKLWTLKGIVDAIYMVPFCSDSVSELYAQDLWKSFVDQDGPAGRYGPMRYYKNVMVGALIEGWKLGGQASFTGYFNNLIIKGQSVNPAVAQRALYNEPGGAIPPVTWTSGDFDNTARASLGYPSTLPFNVVQVGYWQEYPKSYLIWLPQPTDWTFPCNPAGSGIEGRRALAGMHSQDEQNPLATVSNIKKYEVLLDEGAARIPTVTQLSLSVCNVKVCGMQSRALPPATILLPQPLVLTDSTVTARVSHQATGQPNVGGGAAFWTFRSETVTSNCTAEITGAPNLQPGSWVTPSRVNLKSAR
jgi:hypothetical protein